MNFTKLLAGLTATAVVTAIVWHFHGRSWWPPDDGAYAYIAQRILQGSVLHRDIHDIHGGYIHFIHAAAMRLFGEDIVSLRYPLAMLTAGQSVLVYMLLLPRGTYVAFAGAVACGVFSFIQFLNPSANWYVPPIALLIIAVLTWVKPESLFRLPAIGFLLGIALLLRQLSGVFLLMGTITWLLLEHEGHGNSTPRLARAILFIFGVFIVVYLSSKQSIGAILLFGIWPLGALLHAWQNTRIPDGATVRLCARLAIGGAGACLPLLAYHMATGSVSAWFSDAFLDAVKFGGLPFLLEQSFTVLFIRIFSNLATHPSSTAVLNAVFWIILLLLPAIAGLEFLSRSLGRPTQLRWPPAVILAMFYGMVPVHYQITIYLMYSTSLTMLGLLFLARPGRESLVTASAVLALSAVAVHYHAGQPLGRGLDGVILGTVRHLDAVGGLPRASVRMERRDVEVYTAILGIIAERTTPEDKILALPFRPEFYFLSNRDSVFSFLGVPFGIRNEAELNAALNELSRHPPKVIVNLREDKYHTDLSAKLLESLTSSYMLLRSVDDFDVYVLK